MKLRIDLSLLTIFMVSIISGTTFSDTLIKTINNYSIEKNISSIKQTNIQNNDNNDNDDNDDSYIINHSPIPAKLKTANLYLGKQYIVAKGRNIATDPDGDELTITNVVANPSDLVEITLNNGELRIFGIKEGLTSIVITVIDSKGASVDVLFPVLVIKNNPPIAKEINPITIYLGDTLEMTTEQLASDPDKTPFWIDSAISEPSGIVDLDYNRERITIKGIDSGQTTVTAFVYDLFGEKTNVSFAVSVIEDVYEK